jgi:DNA-binding beta-propeller fold protein YncE
MRLVAELPAKKRKRIPLHLVDFHFKSIRQATALVVAAFALGASAQTPAPAFELAKTIALNGVQGKFDHLAIDETGKRLFIAATGNHSVEVVDLKTDKVQQSIKGLGKPHGLAWIEATGSLYVADGLLRELRVYKGSPLALAGSIKLSDDADDMAYDETSHLLFVGHGGSDAANPAKVAIVNTEDFKLVFNLSVAAHPEALESDPAGKRAFANIADASEVAVIDATSKTVSGHWKLTKASDNVPMAFDGQHHLLYIACRKPATVIALDAVTGKEVASHSTVGGADDMFYDPALRRVYVIGGAGEVDAYQMDDANAFHVLAVLHTAAGAKTALFVPTQNLLYVGVPGVNGQSSEIRVFTTIPARSKQ